MMWCRWPSDTLKRCYSLCQHMMHFFHQYLLYVTFEVLEPLWHTMSIHCRAANTLDEVSSTLPCPTLPHSVLPCPDLPHPTLPHVTLTHHILDGVSYLRFAGLSHPLIVLGVVG